MRPLISTWINVLKSTVKCCLIHVLVVRHIELRWQVNDVRPGPPRTRSDGIPDRNSHFGSDQIYNTGAMPTETRKKKKKKKQESGPLPSDLIRFPLLCIDILLDVTLRGKISSSNQAGLCHLL